MPKGTIRLIKEEDVDQVENIFALYWEGDFYEHLKGKLNKYFENDSRLSDQDFKFYVFEREGEIGGVVAMRKIPDHLVKFTKTNKPAELYVIAVKNQGKGTGKKLVEKILKEAKNAGYTELVLFSGETHKNSWGFYDQLNFKRISPAQAPNGEPGQIWSRILD